MQSNDDTMATTPRQSKRLFCLSFETVWGETKRKNNNTNKSSKFIFKHTIKTSIVMRKQNKKSTHKVKSAGFTRWRRPTTFSLCPYCVCVYSFQYYYYCYFFARPLSLPLFFFGCCWCCCWHSSFWLSQLTNSFANNFNTFVLQVHEFQSLPPTPPPLP